MSVDSSPPPSRSWVPVAVTQLPLHGTQTPTIAPEAPEAVIALSTAACIAATVSSGSAPSTWAGGVYENDSSGEHPVRARASTAAVAVAARHRRDERSCM